MTREWLPLFASIRQYEGWSRDHRETIRLLLLGTARATESAILLCAHAQLWDAEVVTRSVLEGSLKFCYLLQDRGRFKARFAEYTEDLQDIARMKDFQKMTDFFAGARPDNPLLKPMRAEMLPASEAARIRRKFSKSDRRALEAKWGFTGLIGELIRSGDPLFRDMLALGAGYSMASHIQHMDYVGVSMPVARDMGVSSSRESSHLAHTARLVSDLVILLYLRMVVGYRYVDCDHSPLSAASEQMMGFVRKFDELAEAWRAREFDE